MRGWRLAALIEGLSRRLEPRLREPAGQYRRYDEVRTRLNLEASYYLAHGSRGPKLIPYDTYMEEVEEMLWLCTNGGREER